MEFLKENKYIIAFLLFVAGIGAYMFLSCSEPSELDIEINMLSCAMSYLVKEPTQIRAEFCEYLKRGPNCEINPDEDKAKYDEMFNIYLLDCTKNILKQDNMCTDKINLKTIQDVLND